MKALSDDSASELTTSSDAALSWIHPASTPEECGPILYTAPSLLLTETACGTAGCGPGPLTSAIKLPLLHIHDG